MLCCNYKGAYIGKDIRGFIKNHVYEFELSNNGRTYELHAYKDCTKDKCVDSYTVYASEISIHRNWKII